MIKRGYFFIFLFALSWQDAGAQSSVLDLGLRFQKTVNLYYENGISADYSDRKLKPGRLYFGFSYATSRLGTAINSNAVKQDNYLVSAAWYFRRNHAVRPFARLNAGYFSANYGDKIFDVLPHTSKLLSPELGIFYETRLPLKISASLGYNLITGDGESGPGTLFPVFYQLTFSWNVVKKPSAFSH